MFKKNVAVTGFTVGMIDASDGSAITSGTVNGYVTKDGGTQTALTNSLTHEGNGQWSVNLTAAEMNADVVGLTFTHSSGIPQYFTIKTVSKLVSDLNDLSAAQVNAEVDTALADYDPPTKAEMDTGLAGLNDLSAAEVNAEVDTALADYDPPTRAELTTDITSILSKLLKYFQLLFRSDAAIATDNATELTAINADEGSGAGDFDNTSDSVEALAESGGGGPTAVQIRQEMDANSTKLSDILDDTNELQTDDVPGLITGLNDLSAAQVNAEVDTALVDYDPPTKAELDAGLAGLNDVTAAEIDTQLTSSHGSGSWSSGAAGSGARTVTVTVQDDVGDPIQNANVRLNATGMPSVVAMTDASGQAVLYVDDATWTVVTVAGSGFLADSQALIVNGDENLTVQLTPVITLPQADPALCTVWVRLRQNGVLVEGGTMIAKLKSKNNAVEDSALSLAPQSVTTDANGYAELGLIREDQFTDGDKIYRIVVKDQYGDTCYDYTGTIPNQTTANLEDMI